MLFSEILLTNGSVKGCYVSMSSININVMCVYIECYQVMNLRLYALRTGVAESTLLAIAD